MASSLKPHKILLLQYNKSLRPVHTKGRRREGVGGQIRLHLLKGEYPSMQMEELGIGPFSLAPKATCFIGMSLLDNRGLSITCAKLRS